ncbi:MAG TPA: hydantoinase/oxoprolinase family protein [Acidimicrobiales bacterium]|nr:hydantoinase/oxoprolinase family protein [Acidimicrobiales bacterium]
MTHALAADIGGTFTDIVLAAPDGTIEVHKRLTDRDQPDRGVIAGVREILERNGVAPASIDRFVHGTTLATNTVLERSGPSIAFVTTLGFGDLLHIGREARVEEDRYDLFFTSAEPPLPRAHVFEVAERVGAAGEVVTPFDEAQAATVVTDVVATKPASVAICFLHAYANPAHEQRFATLLRAALPADVHVVCSSDVLPELREYERATTTLVSAYVAPVMAGYLARLQDGLRELGVNAPLQIMESSGGVMAAQVAASRAVATIESGGAAGVVAAAGIAVRDGLPFVLSFDMGGTTAKAGVVHDGRPRLTHDLHVGGKGSYGGRRAGTGVPVRIPVIDLAEVGVGGGSIAWLAADGTLHVGPRSAGSAPGPACYGLGGTEPTVTDANLVLGYLDPANFAGGAMALDADAGRRAVRDRLAAPLGVDLATAAWAVYGLVNANMASAIHVVTVQRGLDPRDHVPIAFGGAGPMHMVGVADHFDINLVVAPDGAGVTSALGMLATDLAFERSVTFVAPLLTVEPAELARRFAQLIATGVRQMGFDAVPSELVVERLADIRYRGQAHSLTVPVPEGPIDDRVVAALAPAYRAQFHQEFGVDRDAPAEVSAVRVRLRIPVAGIADPVVGRHGTGAARTGTRPAYFGPASGKAYVDTAVYQRDRLVPGDELSGPAIVEGAVDTVVVPPGWTAAVDERRGLRLVRTRA